MSHEPANDTPLVDWDSIVDDDPVIAEIRRIRYEIAAEFDFDSERQYLGGKILAWARGDKYGNPQNPQAPLEDAELPELPADLSGLIPNRERFIRSVRISRSVTGKYAPDLDAYNEDGRHRARVLGFPEDAFVISPSDFPPDFDPWTDLEWEDAPPASETSSGTSPSGRTSKSDGKPESAAPPPIAAKIERTHR